MDSTIDYILEQDDSQMPYSMQLGDNKDKHLIVVGGLHGNEPLGVRAIVEYHKILSELDLDGTVTFILGNAEAHKRYLEGDENARYIDSDLNRAFLDGLSREYSEYSRVMEFMDFFEKNRGADVLLDLHSVSKGNSKFCVYPNFSHRSKELAIRTCIPNKHFVYHHEHLEGAMLSKASMYGINPIAIECGNHKSEDGLDVAMDHITRMLIHTGIVKKELLPLTSTILPSEIKKYTTIQRIDSGPNFKWVDENVGTKSDPDFLRRGEIYACDDDGKRTAPEDCYLMLPTKKPSERDYDVGYLCEKEVIQVERTFTIENLGLNCT